MNLIAEIVVDQLVWQVPLLVLGGVTALLMIYYIYIGITLRMARKRHRDPLGWVLLSFCISPLLTWIILLIAGDHKS